MVKMTKEDNQKSSEYCPMTGTTETTSKYLQPVCDRPDATGYLPMVPSPNYDSCVGPNQPYENTTTTENIEPPTIDMKYEEPDCGMMGYDMPPPMHLYSEILGNNYADDDRDDEVVDDDGNHVYESIDQAKPPQ